MQDGGSEGQRGLGQPERERRSLEEVLRDDEQAREEADADLNDGAGVVDDDPGVRVLLAEDVNRVLGELQHFSVNADAFSRNNQSWTSTTITPKCPSLPHVWQSPEHCHIVAEMDGKDGCATSPTPALRFL